MDITEQPSQAITSPAEHKTDLRDLSDQTRELPAAKPLKLDRPKAQKQSNKQRLIGTRTKEPLGRCISEQMETYLGEPLKTITASEGLKINPKGMLQNPRHEKMAVLIAAGSTDTKAYMNAFDCSEDIARSKAAPLLAKGGIRTRVKELQKLVEEQSTVNQVLILNKAMQNVQIAMAEKAVNITRYDKKTGTTYQSMETLYDGATANNGLMLIAKMLGYMVNKTEIGRPGEFASMEPEKLSQAIIEMLQKANGIEQKSISDKGLDAIPHVIAEDKPVHTLE